MLNYYYSKIFPVLLSKSLKTPEIDSLRKKTLSQANGDILEIGFGTGLNLTAYPRNISHISAVDINHFPIFVDSQIRVDFYITAIESLPFPANTFDTVVSTFTLCSVKDLISSISEIARVLRPNGQFLFLEHKKSPKKRIAVLQDLLNPFYIQLSCGCHVNRTYSELLQSPYFKISQLEEPIIESEPLSGDLVLGKALKASTLP